jgi:hypothetical protein
MSFYRPGGGGTGDVTTTPISVNQGGTGATNKEDARVNLGVTATGADTSYAFRANNLSDLNSIATARTNLGLGTLALQSASSVSISGGTISGVSPIAIISGGTNANTAEGALANLLPSYASNANKVLAVNATADGVEWITSGGTVTSVAMTVPTGLSVAGSPVTSTGTLAVTFSAGYSIPTTTKQGEWDTAYGWGNHASAGYLTSAAIGSTVQGYDADTAKYDDATANFTGTLQKSGSNVLTASNIGTSVQAYDSNLTSFVGTFTLPTTDGTNGQVLSTNGSGTLSFTSVGGSGTVTSVDMSVPTGFAISGNPVTSSGTLALAFASGYSLPTTSSQGNWDTAYGWGNHASAGYLTSAAIGNTVQGYDADTAKYDDATANFTGTLQKSGSNVLTASNIGSTVQGYDADTAKYDDATANFTGTLQKSGNNVLTTASTIEGGTYA